MGNDNLNEVLILDFRTVTVVLANCQVIEIVIEIAFSDQVRSCFWLLKGRLLFTKFTLL